MSQAGITLGFASVVANEFRGWATQVQLLLVGAIAIHELVGPVVFRHGLAQAGELDSHDAAAAAWSSRTASLSAQPRRRTAA